jgi:DNA polymerase-1
MTRLVLIDGNAILHRAFHALPPLAAPDGTVVNAVYGFSSMLLRLMDELKPTHIAVAFDRPKPTFRKELYEGYQIKRPKMDDGLVAQIPLVHDVVAAMRIPIVELDGYEADDVIGTIAAAASSGETPSIDTVIIVTGDRDLLQLVNDRIFTFMPTKGLSEAKIYGIPEATERLGVPPGRIPDFKALAGDQSDNYPGVAGIGPKTAVGLLTEFGSVEAVYTALESQSPAMEKFPPAVRQKLIVGKDVAMLSKNLATIRRDAPVVLPLNDAKTGLVATEEAIGIFERMGFKSLVQRLKKHDGKTHIAAAATDRKPEPKKKPDGGGQMSLL